MNSFKEKISERLKGLMKSEQFSSQKEFAQRCGLAPATVSKAINKGEMSIKTAIQIANTFNVSIDFLFGNSDFSDLQQCALNIINKHFLPVQGKSEYGDGSLFFAISISESFNSDLNGIYEAENANVSEFIKAEWRNEKIQKFKDVLLDENREEQTRQYAFIDISLMTPEVMEIIQRQKFQT